MRLIAIKYFNRLTALYLINHNLCVESVHASFINETPGLYTSETRVTTCRSGCSSVSLIYLSLTSLPLWSTCFSPGGLGSVRWRLWRVVPPGVCGRDLWDGRDGGLHLLRVQPQGGRGQGRSLAGSRRECSVGCSCVQHCPPCHPETATQHSGRQLALPLWAEARVHTQCQSLCPGKTDLTDILPFLTDWPVRWTES